ncbi:MAG: DNA topoisomerase III, partial [Firmicutes bacterium]|nr:DNA topoisomerase III [Bacillota bacterium]
GKILVVAEKPSVGRDIARVLGCRQKGEGCLIGEQYIVSWAVGHLVALCDPEDYAPELKKWRFDTLPIMPQQMRLKQIYATRDQLQVLRRLMDSSEVDSLVCATDSGREGELIFRYIYQLCGYRKPFDRLWVSSMTDSAIREGFARLTPGEQYDQLFYSARCRSEADWLVGINASRAYTLKYNTLLSIGRVQTPTLAIIVQRAQEIAAFVPEEYFELKADFGAYWGLWQAKDGKTTRITTQAAAKELAARVQGQPSRVISVQREEKSQPPPLLYDLTELQRDCNKRFGFSAQKTLNIAQSLYETKKLITYPRTDSRYLSDDLLPLLPDRIKNLAHLEEFAEAARPLLPPHRINPGKRVIDNGKITDHHAIIPTDGALRLNNLTPDEYKVFRLIALRFLAVFYPPYVYASTKVLTEAAGENFVSRGQEVLRPGWTELYRGMPENEAENTRAKKGKADKEEQKLPNLAEGDTAQVDRTEVRRKKTQPPKPYTEAGLLSAMENAGRFVEDEALKEQLKESGLGTPATRAAIIERLLQVGYIQRKGKALIPTEKGEKLIQVVPPEMKSPETTGKWERGLSAIAAGRMSSEVFMGSIRRYVQFLVRDCSTSTRFVQFPEEAGRRRRRTPRKSAGA